VGGRYSRRDEVSYIVAADEGSDEEGNSKSVVRVGKPGVFTRVMARVAASWSVLWNDKRREPSTAIVESLTFNPFDSFVDRSSLETPEVVLVQCNTNSTQIHF